MNIERQDVLPSKLPLYFAAIVGTLASLAAFVLSASLEVRVAHNEFQTRARDHLSTVNTDLGQATALLETTRAFLESTRNPVGPVEFADFASRLHGRTIGLRDLGWAPRVAATDRAAFERAIKEAGFPEFAIREFNGAGKLVPASDRAEYFPILYADRPGGVARIMGLDVAFEPTRRAVIQRAIATRQPAATEPISLVTVQRPRGGIMSFTPVFRTARAAEDASSPPDGLIFGAFAIDEMIESVLASRPNLSGVTMDVIDPAQPPETRLIYRHGDQAQAASPAAKIVEPANFRWDGQIAAIDQRWAVAFTSTADLNAVIWSRHTLMPLVVGMTLTAITLAYLWITIRRTAQLKALTANLQQTTLDLQSKAEAIDHLARHDALTGLPNRRSFADEIERAIGRAARGGAACALLLIDLDRFKPVNDLHGHAMGDAVLREVAARLRSVMRGGDTVARFGGDEFAAIVSCEGVPHAASMLAERLIAALSEPITADHVTVEIGASVGIAMHPQDGETSTELLHAADLAMYQAKQEGRGRFVHFEKGANAQVHARSILVAELRQAIASGDIEPYYQPIIRLDNDALVGFECLARWQHPDRGLIMPAAFIPVAEDAGLLPELTLNLLRQACAAARSWPQDVTLALNVAPRLLRSPEFVGSLVRILAEGGLDSDRLEIEITETGLIEDVANTGLVLHSIREAGIRVALDDFGTGYSSLALLRKLPIDKIKIDRTFVLSMRSHSASAKIVEALASLGSSFQISVTAEGIEDHATARHLAALGVDFGQGYFFGHPMPMSEIPRWKSLRSVDNLTT